MHAKFFLAIANHRSRYTNPRPLRAAALMLYLERFRIEWHHVAGQKRITPTLNPIIDEETLDLYYKEVKENHESSRARTSFP